MCSCAFWSAPGTVYRHSSRGCTFPSCSLTSVGDTAAAVAATRKYIAVLGGTSISPTINRTSGCLDESEGPALPVLFRIISSACTKDAQHDEAGDGLGLLSHAGGHNPSGKSASNTSKRLSRTGCYSHAPPAGSAREGSKVC